MDKKFKTVGKGLGALAGVKLADELPDLELVELVTSPTSLEEDIEAAVSRAKAREEKVRRWLGKLEEALSRKLLPLVFLPMPSVGEEVRAAARKSLANILLVKDPALQARVRWTYAKLLTELGESLGLSLSQVLTDLVKWEIVEEGEWPMLHHEHEKGGEIPDPKFRPEGYYLRLGRKYWSGARMAPEAYREVRETISRVFADLRRMAERDRNNRLAAYQAAKATFRQRGNPHLDEMLGGTPGIYLVDVPPQRVTNEANSRSHPGGTLKIKSDGKSLEILDVFGPFSRFVRDQIIPAAAPYPLDAIKDERLCLGRRVEERTFRALVWIHLALRRAKSQWDEIAARQDKCRALKKEATVKVDEFLLDGVPGRAFIYLSRFTVAKEQATTSTHHQVGMIVERKQEGKNPGPKTKIGVIKVANDQEGLFDKIVGGVWDEFSDETVPFSGCPPLLRRFLTLATKRVAMAHKQEALRRFAEEAGIDEDEEEESNGSSEPADEPAS